MLVLKYKLVLMLNQLVTKENKVLVTKDVQCTTRVRRVLEGISFRFAKRNRYGEVVLQLI